MQVERNTAYEISTSLSEEKSYLYFFMKRLIDIVGSLIGIVLLSPVFLITAVAVKLDSKGPIFFTHKRLGQGGKIIGVYKFRTMVPNAEELLKKLTPEQKKEFEINFKLDNDPRITKVGHVLRKTSLDELPQLFNILIGNMSIVGPRPIITKEIEKYGIYGEALLSIKPGLTGMWQTNGRSNTSYEDRVRLDMEYINKRSIMLDIGIIFKTFWTVIKKQGAK